MMILVGTSKRWIPENKKCVICGKDFICLSSFKYEHGKYCSRICLGKHNGLIRKGKKTGPMSEDVKNKLKESLAKNKYQRYIPQISGQEHWQWKGDSVGYRSLHSWINRNYIKKGYCVLCGGAKITKDGREYTQLSNISHEYKRDIKDYIELCPSCNLQYDYGHISKDTIEKSIVKKEGLRLV